MQVAEHFQSEKKILFYCVAGRHRAAAAMQDKKREFYDDPATELDFRPSKQLKTVESDVEADRVFQQAKAAGERAEFWRQCCSRRRLPKDLRTQKRMRTRTVFRRSGASSRPSSRRASRLQR